MLTPSEKIKELQRQIDQEAYKINNCKHTFGKPYFNPETVLEGYGSVQDGAGSDPHWSYVGYREVHKNRWTRKCVTCGYEQHTNKEKPITVGFEPSF